MVSHGLAKPWQHGQAVAAPGLAMAVAVAKPWQPPGLAVAKPWQPPGLAVAKPWPIHGSPKLLAATLGFS